MWVVWFSIRCGRGGGGRYTMGNEIPRKGMRGHLGDRGAQVAYTEKDLANITVGGMVFNYAGPRQTNSCVRRRIVLADDIDLDKMSIALELTRRRYPQLSLGLEKVGGDVHERHIEAPFKLNRIEPRFHMMGEDTNGHMIAFYAEGRTLLVDFFHAIADDAGMDRFIQTLLYSYFELMGHRLDNEDGRIATADSDFALDEGEDVGARLLDEGNKARPDSQPKKAFKIKGRKRPLSEPDFAYTIKADLPAFLALSKENGATPTVVTSAVFSRILYRHYSAGLERGDNPVTAEVAVNLRNHFPSNTVRNFVGNAYLQYDAALDGAPLSEVLRAQTASLRAQNTEEVQIAFHNHAMFTADKWFNESPLPAYAKNWIHKHIAVRAMENGMTYGISNIGKIQLPACLKPYVIEYYSMIPSGLHAFLVSMRSEGDVLTMCVTSKLHDSVGVVREFARTLRSLGVATQIVRTEDFHYTKYVQNHAVTPVFEHKVDPSPVMDKIMAGVENVTITAHEASIKRKRRRE